MIHSALSNAQDMAVGNHHASEAHNASWVLASWPRDLLQLCIDVASTMPSCLCPICPLNKQRVSVSIVMATGYH